MAEAVILVLGLGLKANFCGLGLAMCNTSFIPNRDGLGLCLECSGLVNITGLKAKARLVWCSVEPDHHATGPDVSGHPVGT